MADVLHIGTATTLGGALRAQLDNFATTARALGIGMPALKTERKVFMFRRGTEAGVWGWDIFLWIGRLCLNLSADWGDLRVPAPRIAPRPRHLEQARRWAVAFAEQHGFEPVEVTARGWPRQPLETRPILEESEPC